jgi:hypothetical protein
LITNLEEPRQRMTRITGCPPAASSSKFALDSTTIMKPALKFRLMLAAALLAASLTGCVAVVAGAAGAGTVAWVRGELEATLDANYEKAATAANLAIKQLQFAEISEKKDALTAILIARTAADKKVEIKVIKIGDQTAKVQIRVGVFGDEALALTILDKIKTNL